MCLRAGDTGDLTPGEPPALPPVTDPSSPLPAVEPAAPAPGAAPRLLLAGGITDEGVRGKVNQDDFFVWRSADGASYVMGVFDGHGRDLGHFAARVTKESFKASLGNEAALAALRANPGPVLHAAFETAHGAVIQVRAGGVGGEGCPTVCI